MQTSIYKSRWILQTLILSVVLNALLLCIFFYFLISDHSLHFSYHPLIEVEPIQPPVPTSFLERLHSVSFDHLMELLSDDRKIGQGYQVRDFALGALAVFHDFDVERGLGRGPLSKRKWEYEGMSFLIFPDLHEEELTLLQTFARTERWPYTAKGMFKHIQEKGVTKSDPDLISFFCHTPEFILVETLFARTHLPIQRKAVLSLVLEGGWERLSAFCEKQQHSTSFSDTVRRAFLMEGVNGGSSTAAQLLLVTDLTFAVEELSDPQIEQVLQLLTSNTEETLQFVQQVVSSPRGDKAREKARTCLSQLTGNAPDEIAGHFYEKPGIKDLRPVFRQASPAAPPPGTHIVQPGESLWLIARKYNISIDHLLEINHLQSTVLRVGKVLKLS